MSDNKTVEEQKSHMLELIHERLQYGSRGGVFLHEEMCREILARLDRLPVELDAALEEAAKLIDESEPDSGSDCCDMAIQEHCWFLADAIRALRTSPKEREVRWLVKRAGWSAVYESEEEALKYANGGRILKLVEDRDGR